MYTAQLKNQGPFSIRYPKGPGVMPDWQKPFREIEIGKGRELRKGDDLAFLSIGHIGNVVANACDLLEQDGIHPAHYDMRFVKPLDESLLKKIFRKHTLVITVEDGIISGGFGSAIIEFMTDHGFNARVKRLGVPDRFIDHGTQEELHHECGFDEDGIISTAKEMVKLKVYSEVN
jgi:1-deoxy-D-xylulose-5-phosphate synthase